MKKFPKLTFQQLVEGMLSGQIQPGPIQHQQLSPVLLKEIKRLWDTVGKFICGTLEQWEIGFMREPDPESEVKAWQRIERATNRYMADHRNADFRMVLAMINIYSMGGSSPEYKPYWEQAESHELEDGQHRHGSDEKK